jgi:hypothetical protein
VEMALLIKAGFATAICHAAPDAGAGRRAQ